MVKGFDYTRNARRFVARLPVFTFILTQVGFWIFAYVFLAFLAHLVLLTADPLIQAQINIKGSIIIALLFGFSYGLVSGSVNWFFSRKFFYKKPLWLIIIGRSFIAFMIFVILISMLRHLLYPYLHSIYFSGVDIVSGDKSWETLFQLFFVYTVVGGLLINFINQVNKKYGPGVLIPMLLGRYRKPREEEMIFLFMDLKSSTPIAESLGHLQYSAFIRDSFLDINSLLASYNAQVYQYVGDEIVITWGIEEGLKDFACIEFFFACEDKFEKDKDIYIKRYNRIPQFKAGLHMGKVTAVEVGDIKRDIAYHGDTLNTAARIQSVCNQYNKKILTSAYIWKDSGVENFYTFESLGPVVLRGKSNPIELLSISRL